jgi:succinyl-diaminopimelate desuccinylase
MALADAVREVSGVEPKLDTGGGTSDARFIALYCPVAEFGPGWHQHASVDEHVRVEDVYMLTRIYERMLERMAA